DDKRDGRVATRPYAQQQSTAVGMTKRKKRGVCHFARLPCLAREESRSALSVSAEGGGIPRARQPRARE
ncbi:MAG TPA: hypothetical protein VEJ86_06895, partial [Candidatus Binataceae bacterium]|nr:hypothetical protein [Candidatus Binataceae bacterium]